MASVISCKQQTKKIPPKKNLGEHTLPVPAGWETEFFSIPIEFAPQIPYKGVEEIRFAPGWGKTTSNEYWTYAFLWCLENNPRIDAKIIENNLEAYYTGLISTNIQKYHITKEQLVPTEAGIEKSMPGTGDLETYKGTIHMLDYMMQKPIKLNCIVHVRACPGQDKLFIFHEISPKPFTDSAWKDLNNIWTGFECSNNEIKR